MRNTFSAFLFAVSFLIVSCGDASYKPPSRGTLSEIIVVMDSTHWNSELSDALHNSFGAQIPTIPRPEPYYDLYFRTIQSNRELETLKKTKNIIFAAPLNEDNNVSKYVSSLLSDEVRERVNNGEHFAFPLKDRWATDQWVLILAARDMETLVERVKNDITPLVAHLDRTEKARWTNDVFKKAENISLSDSVSQKNLWKIRVQHDYELSVDTTQFVSFARLLPEIYRYVWVFWDDNIDDVRGIDEHWINARRDTLFKHWVQGTRDGVYMKTEYGRPVLTDTVDFKGYYALNTRGTWKLSSESMGGSFVQYSVFVPEQRRLYYLIGGLFAPNVEHRRYINQFEAILWSFSPINETQSVAGVMK